MGIVELSELERDAVSSEVELLKLFKVFEIEIVLVFDCVYERGSKGFLLDWFWRKGKECIGDEAGKRKIDVLAFILSWHSIWYFNNYYFTIKSLDITLIMPKFNFSHFSRLINSQNYKKYHETFHLTQTKLLLFLLLRLSWGKSVFLDGQLMRVFQLFVRV